jgi:hypothetical protein
MVHEGRIVFDINAASIFGQNDDLDVEDIKFEIDKIGEIELHTKSKEEAHLIWLNRIKTKKFYPLCALKYEQKFWESQCM